MIKKVNAIIKSEPVLAAAWLLAILSAFWVRPDLKYIDYIDMDTLFLLFGLMAAMANLISYKWVCKEAAHFRHAYVRLFTLLSLLFLAVECMLYFCIKIV